MLEACSTEDGAQVAARNVFHDNSDASADRDQVVCLNDGAVAQQAKHAGFVVHSCGVVIVGGEVVL